MKVLLGDDHRLFRDGVRLQLQEFDGDLTVIDAADFSAVFACLQDADDVDLALIDLNMPGTDWRDGLRALARDYPSLPVVVVSATDEQNTIIEALDLGAAGFIPKTSSGEVMINALRLVLAGGVYLPPEVISQVPDHTPSQASVQATGKEPAKSEGGSSGLSPRQMEVLLLIADGKSNKQIASILGLSDGTVKTHIASILRTLDVNNRTQAILAASRKGILQID